MKLYIFKPNKNFYFSIYLKILLGLIFLLSLAILLDSYVILIAIVLVLYLFFYSLINLLRTGPLNGRLEKFLELKENHIVADKDKVDLNEISKIEINSSDIKGDFIGYSFSLQPSLSNGTNNYIKIYLKDSSKRIVYFQQSRHDKIKFNRSILESYYKKGIISWLNLLDVLEISKYEEIQKFKKQINTHPHPK